MTEVTTLYADQLEYIARLTWIDRWPLNREARERVNLCRKDYLEKCYLELFDITTNNIFNIRKMNYEAMVFFSTLPESRQYINNITTEAASIGDQILLNRMLALGATNYKHIAIVAAYGGHSLIVNQMINLGADNYFQITIAAVSNGHVSIVDEIDCLSSFSVDDYTLISSEASGGGLF